MAIDRAAFYANIERQFGRNALKAKRGETRAAREGFDAMIDAFERLYPNESPQSLAYILATAWHETGATMIPVRETFAKSDEQAVARLSASKSYARRNDQGKAYYGRGYVQLTHDYNYKAMGERLGRGLALLEDPDLVMDPALAAEIICIGMFEGTYNRHGQGLKYYVDAPGGPDYVAARYTVNIQDKAEAIAEYARKFEAALTPAITIAPVPIPVPAAPPVAQSPPAPPPASPPPASPPPRPQQAPPQTEAEKPLAKSRTIWSAAIAFILGVFAFLAHILAQFTDWLRNIRYDLKDRMGGFDPLWILAGVFVVAMIVIVYARIDDRMKKRR